MWKTLVRRLLLLIPQLFLLSLLIFIMASKMPGDALTGQIDPKIKAERLEELRQKLGYYDAWPKKYARWMGNALQGDLGISSTYKLPVTQVIAQKAGNTFWLALVETILLYLIAIPLGIIAGRYHDKMADRVITLYTYVAFTVPLVVFGILNVFIFCFKLKIFPYGNSVSVSVEPYTFDYVISRIYHMLLPAITGAVLSTGGIIQYLRSEIVDYENSDFVVTARSKGVPQNVIYSKHITRNALIPVASTVGLSIALLITGSIFIETVFSYPGMGLLFIDSISKRDYSVVNSLVILYAILIVVGNLISDITLSIVDPRIRIK